MMGKVLVRKASADATNLVSSVLGGGPKSRLGAGLGGALGGLSFLTRLATAGEQQQDAVSGLGSAGLAAYGGYKGGASIGDSLTDAGLNLNERFNPMSGTNVAVRDANKVARQQKRALRRYPHLPRDASGNLPRHPEGHEKEGQIDMEASGLARAREELPASEGRGGTKGDWDAWSLEGFNLPQEDSWMPSWLQDDPFRAGFIGKPSKSGDKQSVRGFKGWQPGLFDATETDFRLTTDKIDPATGKKKLTALGKRIEESKPAAPLSTPMHAIQAGNAAAVLHPWEHSPKAGVAIAPPASPDPFKPVQGTAETDMPSSIDQSMGGNEDGEHITPETGVAELNPEGVASFAGDPEHEKMIEEFHNYFGKGEPMDIAFLILKAVMK